MTHLDTPFLLGQFMEVFMGSLGSIVKFVLASMVMVFIGTFIINRVAFLKAITG